MIAERNLDYAPYEKEGQLEGKRNNRFAEIDTKSTRKKFSQSWVFNILKSESTISPNEKIIRHNIFNV